MALLSDSERPESPGYSDALGRRATAFAKPPFFLLCGETSLRMVSIVFRYRWASAEFFSGSLRYLTKRARKSRLSSAAKVLPLN